MTFSHVAPPANYTVTRVGFQQFVATAPNGRVLGTFSMQRYAANRCHRDFAGLAW